MQCKRNKRHTIRNKGTFIQRQLIIYIENVKNLQNCLPEVVSGLSNVMEFNVKYMKIKSIPICQ